MATDQCGGTSNSTNSCNITSVAPCAAPCSCAHSFNLALPYAARAGRQLVAAGRQLIAADRQLTAADRQLIATSRQLIAADTQLIASTKQLVAANSSGWAAYRQIKAAGRQLVTHPNSANSELRAHWLYLGQKRIAQQLVL